MFCGANLSDGDLCALAKRVVLDGENFNYAALKAPTILP
jgi:hypothetical protein